MRSPSADGSSYLPGECKTKAFPCYFDVADFLLYIQKYCALRIPFGSSLILSNSSLSHPNSVLYTLSASFCNCY